jgi:hypothetical protein
MHVIDENGNMNDTIQAEFSGQIRYIFTVKK